MSARFNLGVENEWAGAGRDGRTRLFRETKFSGANGDRVKKHFLCSADHEQDRQPYPVDLCSGSM